MTKINNRRRRHNAPETQRKSWKKFRNSPKRFSQRSRVLEYLTKQPANSRQLTNDLKIERGSITRTLKDLEDAGQIEIVFEAKCPISGLLTQFYGVKTGKLASAPTWIQGALFDIVALSFPVI